jgi:sigma-B regulation protein RsbU (phosphoserine phosphatase)
MRVLPRLTAPRLGHRRSFHGRTRRPRLSEFVRRRVLPTLERYSAGGDAASPRILFDLAEEARGAADLDALFRSILGRIAAGLDADGAAVFVREESGRYVCRMSTRPGWVGGPARPSLAADAFVVTRLRSLQSPLEIGPADFDAWSRAFEDVPHVRAARERERRALEDVHARLLVPIRTRDQNVGILALGPRPAGALTPSDRALLLWTAGQLGFVIENGRLIERMVASERLRRELALAATVQQRLFPAQPPVASHLELAGCCQPARGVGGDYYDFVALERDQIGIVVADVAGKGISAALVMSNVQAALRSQAAAHRRLPGTEGSAAETVADINRLLCGITDGATYVTFFYALVDPEGRRLTYVNGGHNAPVVANADGETRTLHATGLPLGILPDATYEEETVSLRSGDLLLDYTDGVTESQDGEGEEFGEDRLHALVAALAGASADDARQAVVEAVQSWSAGTPPHDDLTVVAARVM